MPPPQGKKPKKKTAQGKDSPGIRKDTAEYVTGGEFGRYFGGM
jgi:hypothetical protein